MVKQLFFHSEENNFYPYALRFPALFTYVLFLLIFNIVGLKFFVLSPAKSAAQTAIDVSQLYSLTDQDRSQNGLKSLSVNQDLVNAAQAHGEDMFQNQYWGHYSPTGKSPWDFIVAAGYSYSYAGENLAKNFTDASSTNTAWLNSSEHRDNIMNSQYTDIGIAVVTGTLDGTQQTIVVQMFGSPSPSQAATTTTPTPQPTSAALNKVDVVGQQQGTVNSYNVTLNAPSTNTTQVQAKTGNYSTVLNKQGNSYTGVLAIPQSVQDSNTVILTTYTKKQDVQAVYAASLPLSGNKSAAQASTNWIQKLNPFAFIVNHMQMLSFTSQVNLLMILIISALVALDAFMFYKLELKDQRNANPLLHLPVLLSVLVMIIFTNKGSVL